MNSQTQGIVWMLLSCVGAAIMVIMVRALSHTLHPFQIVFFRNFFGLVWLLPWLSRAGLRRLKTDKLPLYTLRGVIGLTAMLGWFYSLSVLPLANATALSFTAPLFTAVIAMGFLGEPRDKHRIASLIFGFIGVLIVLKPTGDGFDRHVLLMLAVPIFWAGTGILIKLLTRTEPPSVVVFYMTLFMAPLSLPFAIPFWQPVSINALLALICLGLVSNLFQFALATALSKTALTVTLPIDFTRLIFVSLLAYLFFHEVPGMNIFIGGAVILASTIYSAWRESHAKIPV